MIEQDAMRDKIIAHFSPPPALHDVAILAHVHCLPSVAHVLVPWLRSAGFSPDQIVIVPKPYSTVPAAYDAMAAAGVTMIPEPNRHFRDYESLSHSMLHRGFERLIERAGSVRRLLLLDDGGILTDMWSRRYKERLPNTVSIQQTTSGTARPDLPRWGVNFVDAARSAAKTIFESPCIARGVVRKLRSLSELDKVDRIGVVGVGALGSRVASELARRGHAVLTFDRRQYEPRAGRVTARELFRRSRIIMGCTGFNWLSPMKLERLAQREHTLISCSSRSIEFQLLLEQPYLDRPTNLFATRRADPPSGEPQLILNGGFPINFDRQREWEKDSEIILTRALIFAAILQAMQLPTRAGCTTRIRLDSECQRLIVTTWLKANDLDASEFGVDDADLSDPVWWQQNSAGADLDRRTRL